jgi:mono/diheme cytochrome c family protein
LAPSESERVVRVSWSGRYRMKAPWLVPFGWSYSQALDIVRHGGSGMPAFPESELSDDALKQIVDYLKTLNQTHVK